MNLEEEIKAFREQHNRTHFCTDCDAFLEKFEARINPVLAHLQNFPSDMTDAVNFCLQAHDWKEVLDKLMKGDVEE